METTTCRFISTTTTTTTTPFETDETATTTESAVLMAVSEALARQLEQEYLDEYLARQMQFITTMDFPDNPQQPQQQQHQQTDQNNNNNNKITVHSQAMSLLDDLQPDVDCQICWSDDDDDYDDDHDDEQKSNKDDSKFPAVIVCSRGGAASFGATPQSSTFSIQQQKQRQQQHQQPVSFNNDTFSCPAAQRVEPSSSTTATSLSCSSLQRALRLERESGGGGDRLARPAVPPTTPQPSSSLQRALRKNEDDAAVAVSEAVAQELQEKFDREELLERQQQYLEAETLMQTSVTGRAWKFVAKVLALHEQYKQSGLPESNFIVPLAKDDLVFLAERFIQKQDTFREQNRPTAVSLGFHFTNAINLSQIRSNGLLTKQERDKRSINSTFNGSVYGDGVYTASDVTVGSAGRYGDIGIICACLNGKEKKGGRDFSPDTTESGDDHQNSNALKLVNGTRMIVLKESSQCLGIFEFPRFLIADQEVDDNAGLTQYWVGLHQLVEEFFNQPAPIPTRFAI